MKEQVAEIVAAYLRKNSVAPSDVPAVITQVYQSLTAYSAAARRTRACRADPAQR
jgi:predicted transcriptional regulator